MPSTKEVRMTALPAPTSIVFLSPQGIMAYNLKTQRYEQISQPAQEISLKELRKMYPEYFKKAKRLPFAMARKAR